MRFIGNAAPLGCLAVVLFAWQKVDLKDVDISVKKGAAEQAAANKAQAESTALDRYKQKERENAAKKIEADRFKILEDGLAEVKRVHAEEIQQAADASILAMKKAAEDHDDLVKALRTASIGLMATLLGSIILYTAKAISDGRHHAKQEAQITGLVSVSNHIKELVNSTYTAALQGRLDASKVALAALLEVVALAKKHGENAPLGTVSLIDEARKVIVELEVTLADRSKV